MRINTDAKTNHGIMDAGVSGISAVPETRKQKIRFIFTRKQQKSFFQRLLTSRGSAEQARAPRDIFEGGDELLKTC